MGMQSPNNKSFSEINVTPLVDVMLVLLIVFMMAAPLMTTGIDLKLPKTKKVASVDVASEQLVLSIDKDGKLYIKESQLSEQTWIRELKTRLKDSSREVVYVRADENVLYGKVAKVISIIKTEGIAKVSLITENIQ